MGGWQIVFRRIAPLQAVRCCNNESSVATLDNKASPIANDDDCGLQSFQNNIMFRHFSPPLPCPIARRAPPRTMAPSLRSPGPDQAGAERYEQPAEQAERDHGAGLDKMEGGGAHPQRRGL